MTAQVSKLMRAVSKFPLRGPACA